MADFDPAPARRALSIHGGLSASLLNVSSSSSVLGDCISYVSALYATKDQLTFRELDRMETVKRHLTTV